MLEEMPAYLYSKSDTVQLEKELAAAKSLGIDAESAEITTLPFITVPALRFNHQAQFNPLSFLNTVSDKLTVYENTFVLSVEDNVIKTNNGTVTADKIVMATHYPFINAPGYYFIRMHQERSYVLALENAPQLNGMYYGIDADGLSFRNSGKYLLIGVANHRTGENSQGGKYNELRKYAKEYFPQSSESAYWSAQDGIPLDGVPYIGQYSSSTPYMFTATGFQKWGMTSSMVSAMIISDLICGKPHPYPIFSPQRFNISASAKLLFEETIQSVKGLASEILDIPIEHINKLPKGHGGIIEYKGSKTGVYKDDNGEVFCNQTLTRDRDSPS
jgi:glycine/D-amino acid oxidase-like deaminating enzyme